MFAARFRLDHQCMKPIKRGPAGTTIAAAVVHFVVVAATTALWMLAVLIAVAFSRLSDEGGRNTAGGDLILFGLLGIIIASVFVWCGVALIKRRTWARWVLISVYGFALSLQVLASLQTIAMGQRVYFNAIGPALCGAVLVLLLHPTTNADFASPTTFTVGPGWYPDPSNGNAWRFWDGAVWTNATSPR